jgi:hypothetical protein
MDCRVKPGNDGRLRFPGAMQRETLLRRTGIAPNTGVRYDPGSAAHRKGAALRPGHETSYSYAPARPPHLSANARSTTNCPASP